MTDPVQDRTNHMWKLAQLRRLYHHVIHGGRTTLLDEHRIGFVPTKERLAAEIERLEGEVSASEQWPSR